MGNGDRLAAQWLPLPRRTGVARRGARHPADADRRRPDALARHRHYRGRADWCCIDGRGCWRRLDVTRSASAGVGAGAIAATAAIAQIKHAARLAPGGMFHLSARTSSALAWLCDLRLLLSVDELDAAVRKAAARRVVA